MSLFDSGIRPAVDAHLLALAAEKRDYGEYWSASSAGYCMRRVIFERLGVPHVEKEGDGRKQRIFTAGHIFHQWIQEVTKAAGISIAQELELQDEDLMIRGHIDDLVLISTTSSHNIKPEVAQLKGFPGVPDGTEVTLRDRPQVMNVLETDLQQKLILYDYKTQNSRAFTYQKGKPISYYHKMQLGTYMYMLNEQIPLEILKSYPEAIKGVSEARILKISKDDLRMDENQLMWTDKLEAEILQYWLGLNQYWKEEKIPKCTCADHEGGFLAREAYNPYFYGGEPCSLELYKQFKETNV